MAFSFLIRYERRAGEQRVRKVVLGLQPTSLVAQLQVSVFRDNRALLLQHHRLFTHTVLKVSPPGSRDVVDPLATISSLCPPQPAPDDAWTIVAQELPPSLHATGQASTEKQRFEGISCKPVTLFRRLWWRRTLCSCGTNSPSCSWRAQTRNRRRPQGLEMCCVCRSVTCLVGSTSSATCTCVSHTWISSLSSWVAPTRPPRHTRMPTARVQALIRGTPGIGKSFFLTFLLWSIIQRHRAAAAQDRREDISIVYRHEPTNFLALVYLKSNDVRCFRMRDEEKVAPDIVHRIVRAPNNWVLLDACTHIREPNSTAHCDTIAPPRAPWYEDYAKHVHKLWMPVWDRTELSDCRLQVFHSTISRDRLERVAEVSGPIPCLVFNDATYDANDHLEAFETDVANAIPPDLAHLGHILSEVRAGETSNLINHRLIHITVRGRTTSSSSSVTLFQMTVASDHSIEVAVLEKAMAVVDPPPSLLTGQPRAA